MLKHIHIEEVPVIAPRPNRRSNLLSLAFACVCAGILLVSPVAFAQSNSASGTPSSPITDASAAPSFEVATIKPHPGMATMRALMYQPNGFTGTVTLSMLVENAYGLLTEDRVSSAPDWAKNEWFDVQMKIGEADLAEMQKLSSAESNARRKLMLQALLTERFKLKAHAETKQVPVYELVVAKGGSKLIDAATDSNPHLKKGQDGKPLTNYFRSLKDTTEAQGYSTKALADFLSVPAFKVGRPVLDKTGLTGAYDFTLNWSIYALGGSPDSPEDNSASIFGALEEVGLKLQPATGPIDIIVIDHVEQPTEN